MLEKQVLTVVSGYVHYHGGGDSPLENARQSAVLHLHGGGGDEELDLHKDLRVLTHQLNLCRSF
jgi:hypothetical protein